MKKCGERPPIRQILVGTIIGKCLQLVRSRPFAIQQGPDLFRKIPAIEFRGVQDRQVTPAWLGGPQEITLAADPLQPLNELIVCSRGEKVPQLATI